MDIVVTVPTQMSHGGNTVPTPMSQGGNMQDTSASAASKHGPPSSRWVSMLGPPTCLEPDAGSSKLSTGSLAPERAQRPSDHRSGTSCAHISPTYTGRSIIGKDVKISHIAYFDKLLLISTN